MPVGDTFEEREQLRRDEFDLRVDGRYVAVKSRALVFDADPASFPYETAMVGKTRIWRRWRETDKLPVAVLIVSQETGAIVVAPVSTASQWRQRTVIHLGEGFTNWEVPRPLLRTFDEFVEWAGGTVIRGPYRFRCTCAPEPYGPDVRPGDPRCRRCWGDPNQTERTIDVRSQNVAGV